jgi:hypothetical protein
MSSAKIRSASSFRRPPKAPKARPKEMQSANGIAGDEALRREVQSLLDCDERGQDFMKKPALDVVAKALES